uniref:Uncharacterized protein n=1 Tax=Meloidogyne hapla TaxID=6305 RepID=A0A1I8BHU1_MELHA
MKTSQQHLMVQQQQKLSKKFNDFSGKFRETVTRFSEEREKNVRLEKEVKQLSEKNQSLENGMKILQNEVKCLNLHLKNVLEIETETRQTQTDDVVDAERCISEEPKHRLEKWQTDILQNFLQLNFSKYLNEKKIRLSETATAEEVSINEDKHPVNEPCEQMTKTNDGDNFVTTQQ